MLEYVIVLELTGISTISLPQCLVLQQFELNCTATNDRVALLSAFAEHLRDELFVLKCVARATNAGGLCWIPNTIEKRGLAMDQVLCLTVCLTVLDCVLDCA